MRGSSTDWLCIVRWNAVARFYYCWCFPVHLQILCLQHLMMSYLHQLCDKHSTSTALPITAASNFFFFKACLLLELALLLQFCYYFILMRCDCSYLGIIFLCYALLSTTTAYVSLPNTTSSICINCWFLKGCAAEIGKMVWAGCWWWLKWWDWAEKSNGGILVRVLSTDWYCWTMEWLWSNEMIAGRDSRWC